MTGATGGHGTVCAWDLPTRLFHWTLVLLVASAWVSYEFAEAFGDVTLVWHRWSGLAILTLLVWRLLWGLVGSSTSRFSSFVRAPSAAIGYARALFSVRSRHYLGHNPLGAYMVLALISTLILQGAFGLFAVDDNDLTGGPLYRLLSEDTNKWATSWHGWLFDWLLLPLIVLHIVANLLYGVVKNEPLITAMLTGRKPAAVYEDLQTATVAAAVWRRALACLAGATLIVFGTILALGGRIP